MKLREPRSGSNTPSVLLLPLLPRASRPAGRTARSAAAAALVALTCLATGARAQLGPDDSLSSESAGTSAATLAAGLEWRGRVGAQAMSCGCEGVCSCDHGAEGHHHHAAPIGLMGTHLHPEGEWMISLHAMQMHMEGNRDGESSVSADEVVAPDGYGYMVAPLEMDMTMVMLGGMYGISDDLTLMAMLPFVDQTMDHRNRAGVEFTTKSSGIGDARLALLGRLWSDEDSELLWQFGLSLPTGSITETDDVPAMGGGTREVRLPYPMQLGSGTWDLLPGLTYVTLRGDWTIGAQGVQTIRLEENDEDYRLGNRSEANVWASHPIGDGLDASLRLAAVRQSDIHGADSGADLGPAMVPTADPDLRAGNRLDLFGGLRYASGAHELGLEVGVPVYQNLDGPQLETDWIVSLGWRVSF